MKVKTRLKYSFAIIMIALALPLALSGIIAAAMSGKEAPLNPDGQPFELFRDSQGQLWISDYWEGEVWRVTPETGAYTAYSGLYGASDGRTDAAGNLWWTDLEAGNLGRLIPGQNQATLWNLGADAGPLGLAFGSSDQVWIADAIISKLYRFTPAGAQLCTYTVPNNGTADYVLFHNNLVWMGDPTLGRIARLDPNTNIFSTWQLPAGSYPQGLATDDLSRIWWADPGRGVISNLNPANGNMASYTAPAPGGLPAQPITVVISDGQVWYTDQSGRVGKLDPAAASPSENTTIAAAATTITPSCASNTSSQTAAVGQQNGQLNWSDTNYSQVVNSSGWQVYQLPQGASPWGLAVNGSNVWFNDQGSPGTRSAYLGWIDSSAPGGTANYLPVIIGK